jgi:hypothetical protein
MSLNGCCCGGGGSTAEDVSAPNVGKRARGHNKVTDRKTDRQVRESEINFY